MKNQISKIKYRKKVQYFAADVFNLFTGEKKESFREEFVVTEIVKNFVPPKSIVKFLSIFLAFLFLVLSSKFSVAPVGATAGINKQINFQGKLVNKVGETNIANGDYSFTFKFFDAASGGTQLPSGSAWTETKTLTVTNGVFRTALGDTTAIPSTLDFNSDSIYLDMTFNGETFSTRIRMTSVPYAFNADKVNGLTVSNTSDLPVSSTTKLKFVDGKTVIFNNTVTFSGVDSKTLTLNDSTTIGTNAITFAGGASEILTLAANKAVTFADAFTTTGAFPLTLTSSATTVATLPPGTITLVDLAATQTLTGKTIAAGSNTITGLTNTNLSGTAGITGANIANDTITTTQLASTLTFASTDYLDLSAVTHGTTPLMGIRLPNAASATPSSPTGGLKGFLAYDTAGNQVIQYNGSAWVAVGGGGGCSTCLFQIPTTIAQNTITPATTAVVGLTVNATNTGTAAQAAIFNQTQVANAVEINANVASNTANALSITSNSLTTGKGLSVLSSTVGLTTGNLANFTLTGNNAANLGTLVKISNSGGTSNAGIALDIDTNSGQNGLRIIHSGTATNSVGLFVNQNGASGSPNVVQFQRSNLTAFAVDSNGQTNIGNPTTAVEKLNVNGNVLIGAQADATSGTATTNSAAGTFGSQTAIDRVQSSVVFRGKLFVATAETNLAGVYRYDGGTTWTLVTNAAGKAVAGDATDADAFVMTVYNDKLYIANQTGAATGAIYSSSTADTTADSFTIVNATRGTSAMSQTTITGYTDLAVFQGSLFVATQLANLAEIGRYDGGTAFTQINITDGKTVAETTADKDGHILEVYNGRLYAGSISASTTNIVAAYNGGTNVAASWVNLTVALTGGNFGADTAYSDTNSMAVYDGALYLSMSKTAGNAAAVYMLNANVPVAATAANFVRVNTTVGKLIAGDATDQDSIILGVYNGRLYGASNTGSTTAALYEYPQAGAGATDWTLIGTRGTLGSDTSIDSITSLTEFNGTLYLGTLKSDAGSVYTFTKTSQNSFALKFDSGSANYGAISFVGNRQANDNSDRFGTFQFSNAIAMTTGAFDYAEDYPTVDSSLEAGEIVSIDPENKEYIKRASRGDALVGIISEKPGFRLSATAEDSAKADYRPVALVGRVPVKVTTENGEIKAGDYITISSQSGVGMKATKAGSAIGVAMEPFSGCQDDNACVGKIIVYVTSAQINGARLASIMPGLTVEDADLTDSGLAMNSLPAGSRQILRYLLSQKDTIDKSNPGSEIFTDRVVAGLEIVTPRIVADEIFARNIKADHIEGLEILVGGFTSSELGSKNYELRIKSLEALLASQSAVLAPASATASNSAKPIDIEASSSVAIAPQNDDGILAIGGLIVNNSATVSADLRVKGGGLFEGILNVIDTIMTKNIIVSGISDFFGKVIFHDDVEFRGRPSFNKDTAGIAVIKKDFKEIEVKFDREYDKAPVVNASIALDFDESGKTDEEKKAFETMEEAVLSGEVRYTVTKVTKEGFVIKIDSTIQFDLPFAWTALSLRDEKILGRGED